jgi:predicted TPR repeat methyltransferase
MATDTAPPLTSAYPWQVPVFFLGVLALAAVTLGRPYLERLSPSNPEHLLAGARTAMAATPPDYDAAADAARRLVERTELPARLRGEGHLIVGSVLLARAEAAAPPDVATIRQQARHHLEQADALGVPDSERGRLTVRLARAWLATDADPQLAIKALTRAADSSDEPFEAYGLLVEAYGRLKTPDPVNTLEALRQQVARAPDKADPARLAQARLKLAELLLQAQNVREAKLVLLRIGSEAAPDVLFTARKLAARCHEESQDWAAAARAWEALSKDNRLTGSDKAQALHLQGKAHFNAGQPAEAAAAWQSALALGGPEAQAAALRLAELRIADDPPAALAALTDALKSVHRPEDYRNAVATLDELRGLFERCGEQLRAKGQADVAAELAKLYVRVAAPGRADAQLAAASAARADALAKAGAADAGPVYVEAARSFAAAAGALKTPDATWLWLAADNAIKGRDYVLALEVLAKYVTLEAAIGAERVADAWHTAGEVHENRNDAAAATAAYQRCLSAAGPVRFRARYRLAHLGLTEARRDHMAGKDEKLDEAERLQRELRAKVKFDDAEKLLQDNLTDLRQAAQPDAAVQELTVFGLADVAYERGDFGTAEPRLQGALQEYPESRHVTRARYRLALCVYRRAVEENKGLNNPKLAAEQRARLQRQFLDNLALAQGHFAAVDAQLAARPEPSLAADEREMLARSAFAVAELNQAAGKYEDALKSFEELARRFDGRPEGLQAVYGLWHCQCHYLNQPQKALDQLIRLQEALEKVPDAAFDGSTGLHSKDYWINKIVEMGKQMK